MKAICPNNREHKEFISSTLIIEDWKVDSEGNYISTTDRCIALGYNEDEEEVWKCATCGSWAIMRGDIIELYATVLEGQEDCYANIYIKEKEANSQIGKLVNGVKVVAVKKGYSLAPKGSTVIYDEAPDFCESRENIENIAIKLGIDL